MEQYNSIQQILKKENGHDRKPIYPSTVIQAVFDAKTGASLEAILAQFNSIYVQYQGSPQDTRNIIPVEMRRAGLKISYMDMDGVTIEEQCRGIKDKFSDSYGDDENWFRYDNLLENIEKTYYVALDKAVSVIDKLKDGVTPDMLSEAVKQLLTEAGATITNLPDEEDLTTTGGMVPTLKFKDKEYLPELASGLGRIYLRKNIKEGKNTLTQNMVSKPNTIYVIQYDYDLNGAEITIPENCVLQFEGGSIVNGTIILSDNCKILGKINTIFNANIIVKGKNVTISNINIETSEVCIYGEHPYDVSNLEINSCNLVSTKNNCIKIVTDTLDGVVENINIRNSNMKFHRMGIELQNHGTDSVRFNGGTITNCKFSLLDISSYNYGYAISLSGRGNNINITDCLFDKCYMGIELVGFNYTIISNNKMINGIGNYLIAATNVRRMTGTLISNNTFDGQELFITNTDRAHIIDNIFTNNRGITFTESNRCLFKENNCIFTSNATTAVMLDNSYNCRIEDNHLDISASTNFFSIMRAYGSNAKYNVFRSNFIAKPEGGNVFDQINKASNNYCYDYYFINDGSHSSTEINSLNNNITSSVNSLKNTLSHKVSESFSTLPVHTCCLIYGVNNANKVSNPKFIIRKLTALDNNKIDINLKFMFRDGNNQHYANVRLVDSSYSLKNPYVEKSGSMSSINYTKTTDGDYTLYTITFSGSYEDAMVQGFAYCSSGHNISWCS